MASVYGVEPNIQCMRADTQDDCLKNVQHKVSDVVIVDQDTRLQAERDYDLKPILYEYAPNLEDKYVVVAVIRAASKIKSGFGIIPYSLTGYEGYLECQLYQFQILEERRHVFQAMKVRPIYLCMNR